MNNNIYQERVFFSSKGKTLCKLLQYIFNYWRTVPLQLAYMLSSSKKLVLSDFGTYHNMLKSVIYGKHNRNLFYHRMGRSSILYSWVLPEEQSLKLPFSCQLGFHAHFVHNDCCHINAERIGDNFICYPHVVIGSKNLQNSKKPVIGNDVTIGTGAVIVGDIRIGNNVQISANAFVNRNVPDNAVVLGNPAMIIKLNNKKVNIPL